jgi:hypothetical protein
MRKNNTNNTSELSFMVRDTTPVLSIKGSQIEKTDKKLFKGTIIKGFLKNRVVNFKGQKTPFKFIQLKEENGYISPQDIDIYIPMTDFTTDSNFVDKGNIEEEVKELKKNENKNLFITYGLPVLTGVLGYQIAKKMDFDTKNKIFLTLIFSFLGMIPNFNMKNKQK